MLGRSICQNTSCPTGHSPLRTRAASPRSQLAIPGAPTLRNLVLALFLTTGSGLASEADAAGPAGTQGRPATAPADDGSHGQLGTELVVRSLALLGVRYKWGGNAPETGLDCSGLVRFVYDEVLDRVLPRRSVEISREGTPIERHELKPGDLVFFNTLKRAFSHVGIYIGDNHFVHAPSRGKVVRIESLNSAYWQRRFNGARRLLPSEAPTAMPALVRPEQSPLPAITLATATAALAYP